MNKETHYVTEGGMRLVITDDTAELIECDGKYKHPVKLSLDSHDIVELAELFSRAARDVRIEEQVREVAA